MSELLDDEYMPSTELPERDAQEYCEERAPGEWVTVIVPPGATRGGIWTGADSTDSYDRAYRDRQRREKLAALAEAPLQDAA
jgi:hypothetical protein